MTMSPIGLKANSPNDGFGVDGAADTVWKKIEKRRIV